MKVAAIGIGSNSLRMLVAEIDSRGIGKSVRYRKGLRMFAALDADKNISDEMISIACENILEFKNEAIKEGAEEIHLFATSAVRDAANQTLLTERLFQSTGLTLDICSGDEEAKLSFWGASGLTRTGMIDIGGGSTEIALGFGRDIDDAVSLQMGAVRLYRMKPITTAKEAGEMVEIASRILQPVRNRFFDRNNELSWVGVGGTFTTCAALVQAIPWQEREKIHHYVMTQQSIKDTMEALAAMPLEERLTLCSLQPQRADIVVHGMAILLACMRELNIPEIQVSEHGNLEGYLKSKYVFEKI